MKYCYHCGKQINDKAVVCVHCGRSIGQTLHQLRSQANLTEEDKADTGLIILCVIIPILGLILWAVKQNETPRAANFYGKAALIAFCVKTAIVVVIYVFFFAFISSLI